MLTLESIWCWINTWIN